MKTLFNWPKSPSENVYVELFIGKLRDQLLNGEIFYALHEARVLAETWSQLYKRVRPRTALGYRPPAPEAVKFEPPNRRKLEQRTPSALTYGMP
jgi:hypothetical protein